MRNGNIERNTKSEMEKRVCPKRKGEGGRELLGTKSCNGLRNPAPIEEGKVGAQKSRENAKERGAIGFVISTKR